MRRSRASSDFLHHSEALAYTPVRRPHTHDVVGDGLAIPQHVASLQVSATASSPSGLVERAWFQEHHEQVGGVPLGNDLQHGPAHRSDPPVRRTTSSTNCSTRRTPSLVAVSPADVGAASLGNSSAADCSRYRLVDVTQAGGVSSPGEASRISLTSCSAKPTSSGSCG